MRLVCIVLLSLVLGVALGTGLAIYRFYSRPYDPDKLIQLINADPLADDSLAVNSQAGNSPQNVLTDTKAPDLSAPQDILDAVHASEQLNSTTNPEDYCQYNDQPWGFRLARLLDESEFGDGEAPFYQTDRIKAYKYPIPGSGRLIPSLEKILAASKQTTPIAAENATVADNGTVADNATAAENATVEKNKQTTPDGKIAKKTGIDAGKPQPHLEVERLYQFGVLQNGEVGEHKFVLKNTGNATLNVAVDETSCKCTAAKLGDGRVLPGKSVEILVTWKTADYMGDYSQRVLIKTNDPDLPILELEVRGKVVADARAIPSELSFAAATYRQSADAQFNLFCYKNPPLNIKGYRFLDPAAEEHFKLSWSDLSKETVERETDATAGFALTLTLNGNLPLGPFQQVLILETDSSLQPEIRVPIHGKVSGAISVAGPGWDEDRKTWVLGILDRGATATKSLWIIDRSPKSVGNSNTEAADEEKSGNKKPGIALEIVKVEPKWLQVQLQDPVFLADAGIVRTVVQVTMPPNAPICDYWGHQPQQKGQILLKTSSEESKTLLIYLRFAVKNKE